jgi:hypothetical protein
MEPANTANEDTEDIHLVVSWFYYIEETRRDLRDIGFLVIAQLMIQIILLQSSKRSDYQVSPSSYPSRKKGKERLTEPKDGK